LLAGSAAAQSAAEFDARGNAFRARGEYEKALFEYNHAVRLAPDVARYYADRGRNHLAKGDYTWARADLDQAVRLDPADAEARLVRGVLAFAEARYGEAAADFEAADAKPWRHVARVKLGREDVSPATSSEPCEAAFFTGQLPRAVEICPPDALARAAAVAELKRRP
jgi:tetratricopeptide (TPR) repeat protein